ncbi:unnamed protein product [Linum tenue]|uniref:Uncharacterized protein n=1 Tax=Linum tenue TaxID=586396 RepID=A0AAV0GS39_9ROSI|nr:unnamed protein product [Linum tenue]
MLLVGICY